MSSLYDMFAGKKNESNIEQWKEEQKANREFCYTTIEKALKEVGNSEEKLKAYLDVQSRFDQYSVRNALLVAAQKPDAEKLGDYKYWREQGVYIQRKENAHPILIIEPGNEYQGEDGKMHQGFNPKKMYDVTQTTMHQRRENQEVLDDRTLLRMFINETPVAIQPVETLQDGSSGAVYVPEDRTIYILQGMEPNEMFQVLARELVREQLVADGFASEATDAPAECGAYMLCRRYQIPTEGLSLSKQVEELSHMESQEVGVELSQIRNSTGEVLSRMQRALEKGRGLRESEKER